MLASRTQGGGLTQAMSFFLPLGTSLVPVSSAGSSTPTFTRATTATVTDWESVVRPALSGEARFQGARRVQNLLAVTEDFTNGTWQNAGAGATRAGNVIDAFGGTAAYTLTSLGATSGVFESFTVVIGNTYHNSVYLRRRTGTGSVILRTINNTNVDITASLTTSWQRFSSGAVSATSAVGFFVIMMGTAGDAVDACFPLCEDVTGQSNQNPGEYVSVGVKSSPYHGAGVDGVQYFQNQNGNTVSNNVVTAGTGAAIGSTTLLGYLAEGARTNSALWARDHTNAAWTKTTMTAALDQTGNDGGANSASSLLATAGNATSTQAITLASAAKTVSFDIKRLVGTGAVQISLDNFTTNTDVTALINSSTYTRVTMTQTLANPTIGIRLVTNGDKIAVDYSQLEDSASFASSRIQTTSASVTRNADVLTYVSASNFPLPSSAYAEFSTIVASSSWSNQSILGDQNGVAWLYANSNATRAGGLVTASSAALGIAANTIIKVAGSWDQQVSGRTANATNSVLTSGTGNSSAGSVGTPFYIGNSAAANSQLFGTIRNVRIWTIQLADSQLQGITT